MTEEDTFNRLRREPWMDTFEAVIDIRVIPDRDSNIRFVVAEEGIDNFIQLLNTSRHFDLYKVKNYGWTPEQFIEYARKKYGKN